MCLVELSVAHSFALFLTNQKSITHGWWHDSWPSWGGSSIILSTWSPARGMGACRGARWCTFTPLENQEFFMHPPEKCFTGAHYLGSFLRLSVANCLVFDNSMPKIVLYWHVHTTMQVMTLAATLKNSWRCPWLLHLMCKYFSQTYNT